MLSVVYTVVVVIGSSRGSFLSSNSLVTGSSTHNLHWGGASFRRFWKWGVGVISRWFSLDLPNSGQHLFGVAREEQMLGEVELLLGDLFEGGRRRDCRRVVHRRRRIGRLFFALAVAAHHAAALAGGGPVWLLVRDRRSAALLVRFHVRLQVAGQRKGLVAHLADVRFVTWKKDKKNGRKT